MLKKQYRLKQSVRIRAVRDMGKSRRNRWLALSKLPSDSPQSRFAFSVSRRVGNAVTRNRVKRHIREAIRQYLPCIHGGWDILISAHPYTSQATFDQIECAVADLLQQSSLWIEHSDIHHSDVQGS